MNNVVRVLAVAANVVVLSAGRRDPRALRVLVWSAQTRWLRR
jgi:hypothetical protein